MGMNYLLVFIGGGFGAACRYGVSLLSARLFGTGFPAGTLGINLLGALLMGILVEYALIKGNFPPHLKLLLATGVLGGFTTFSTFALEIIELFQRGQTIAAISYALGSIIAGAAAVLLGMWLVRQVLVVS